MRNGFDGLAGIVRNYLVKDPISGDVFVFLNKLRTHIKLLYWDGDDEFSPEAKILFDASIAEHLTLDIIFALAVYICERIGSTPE